MVYSNSLDGYYEADFSVFFRVKRFAGFTEFVQVVSGNGFERYITQDNPVARFDRLDVLDFQA